MSTTQIVNDYNDVSDIDQDSNIDIKVYELASKEVEKNVSHLINELYSKGVIFSIKISKEKTHLIIYSLNNIYRNEETRENLLNHLQLAYSLKEIENTEDFFIPSIKKVEQDGKFVVLSYSNNNPRQYFFTCLLSAVNSNIQSLNRNFSNFVKDLVQANIFSIILTQFASRNKADQMSNMWGIMFLAKSSDKELLKKKEQTFQRYIKANTTKLNCQLQFLSKREIMRHQINFRLYVPWIKHLGVLNDIMPVPKLLNLVMQKQRIVVPFPTIEKVEEPSLQATVISKPNLLKETSSQKVFSSRKPYPSIRANIPSGIVNKSTTIQKLHDSMKQLTPSNIEDFSVPTPRTMNAVFDIEYLKVRISKIFKEFEFKETLIFEENFDLVLRKETYYVFIKFFKDVLNQNGAYEIVETLSSIAGLRNKFLCIVVADVLEENASKLLNEYNILHLTLTDILVNDSLKAKLYGIILA